MKDKYIDYFMQVALLTAKLSTAKRLQVGCVIVKDNRIISVGYNGTPSGWSNECEYEVPVEVDVVNRTITPSRLVTKPEVLHAEANAITKLARCTESGEGATLFVTHSPCMECAKLIYQSGISTIYYDQQFNPSKKCGLEFLNKTNVEVFQYRYTNEG